MQYYLSAARVTFKVTRTIACDTVLSKVISTGDATPTVQHYADRKVNEDGRLKGINESTTGQGESILKTALSIASAIRVGTVGIASRDMTKAVDCTEISRIGKQAPISRCALWSAKSRKG
jgi:hypothetical protein